MRQDFLHQGTTHLATTKRVILVEDLGVSGLLKNQKLARHIADMGWGEFRRMLADTCRWYGSRLVAATRYVPSSTTTSCCGQVLVSRPLAAQEWDCAACDAHHDRAPSMQPPTCVR